MNTMSEPVTPSNSNCLPDWFAVELARAQLPLLAFVRNLMGGSPDAWDVLQDADQVMCQKAASLKSAGDFLPWAYTIARFKVLEYRRRAGRDRHVFSPEMLAQIADRASDNSTDYGERTAALEKCFQKLPARQQQYIVLRYANDLGVGEIARRVGRGENAVAAALYRARTALADCIEAVLAGVRR